MKNAEQMTLFRMGGAPRTHTHTVGAASEKAAPGALGGSGGFLETAPASVS